MIGRTVSHYQITGELGSGGMGVVYEADDTSLPRQIALKIISPDYAGNPQAKARFLREAKAAAALDHPNVCTVHEIDETDDGELFLAMACYRGETLRERLGRGPVPLDLAADIVRQTAEGLAHAHEQRVVHRDVKPGNIYLTTTGWVKILDFGLAKLEEQTQLTLTEAALGTPHYMSPEQAEGGDVDNRTDVWSLGVVFYELVTGRRPFAADRGHAVVHAILEAQPAAPRAVNPAVPRRLSRLIMGCLAKNAERRVGSAAELLRELDEIIQVESWMITRPSVTENLQPPNRRPHLSWWYRRRRILGAVAFVLAAVAIAAWIRSHEPDRTEVRLAVMPLVNQAHPDQGVAMAGLTEVVHRMADQAARSHPSMWVVRSGMVQYADLARHEQAARAFGVNRILTGGLQRSEGGHVLTLELRDASSLRVLEDVHLSFDPGQPALNELPGAMARLVDLDPVRLGELAVHGGIDGPAARDYLAGLGALRQGDHTAALAALEQVTAVEPGFGPGWCARGTVLARRFARTGAPDDRDRARAWLARAADLSPQLWWPRFRLGEFLRGVGDSAGSLAAYGQADSLDPGNPDVCRGLARIHGATERYAASEAALRSAIRRRPDYFEASRMLGRYFLDRAEYDSALVHLDRALDLAPDAGVALKLKGAIHHARGEYSQARECFERSFAITPNCDSCSNVGLALYHEQKFRESASFYELSLEYCDEGAHAVWTNWGRALYWAEGGRAEAMVVLGKAIELAQGAWEQSPGDPSVLGDLIDLHALVDDRETAREFIAMADTLSVADGDLQYRVGTAYELMGEREPALDHLVAAVTLGVPIEQVHDTIELTALVADPGFARIASAATEAQ
ncbi:MAG: protein kinase [bacterium]|nr:protein kinase [bacterium]